MRKIFLLFAIAAIILFPLPSAAQFGAAINKLDKAAAGTGLTKEVESSVGNVISAVLSIVGTIFFGLTVYAGIRWMIARGNEEEVTKSQEIIKAAVIGLVITLSAYAITAFVTGRLSGQSSGGGGAPTTEQWCKDTTKPLKDTCTKVTGSCPTGSVAFPTNSACLGLE